MRIGDSRARSSDSDDAGGRIVFSLVLVLVLALAWMALACAPEEPPPDPIRPVLSIVVADAEGFRGRRFAGTARAIKESNLAFEVAGRLIERPIDVGDEIERGQRLARLDPRDFEARLKSAEAELKRESTNLARAEAMLAEDVISQAQFDRVAARTEMAEAKVTVAAKALDDSTLLAPFSGRVAAIYVENFENVQAKELVVRLLDISQVEMVVQIPESLIGSTSYVRDITVRFDPFPDVAIPATVKEIGSEASRTTRTYPVTLVMTPPEGVQILAGMAGEATGRVELSGEVPEIGYEVPVAAVFTDDASQSDQSYVWIVDAASQTVKRQLVETNSFGARGALVRGLDAGDRIVIAGVHSLSEGQAVRIAN
jgi:RND family efflux transporter MFP subunit